ncbi:ATP-dependent RNA helicase DBP10 [Mycena indigotica]|uniref:RNA helicase n=1 Tax=Mycena indigotica TaxID=2126181 RepID=A0A8H6WFB0_9AGAR|nr:ATP-dependent RNA helicase DBP10 [Mycena indigotica]KAF7315632.1 ATP-dependent RNA helicase DBP10 [Mycena indigotica]
MSSKRRREDSDNESDSVDIFSALTSKRRKSESEDDDEDELGEFIRTSITKRDIKQGTDIVKKAKGKGKLVKGEVGGGSFQSMGLHPPLLRSLTLQGYRIPTPIQRLSIPALLDNPPRDLVGMARTGSGKSLAYLVPLVQRLGGRHSSTFGARSLILLPTRELALQILKVGKELARGWHAGQGNHAGDAETEDSSSSKSQNLRWSLIVGGEGMDEQFETIANNPDVIIATPGRLLHLIVEMNLDLKSVQYVVFDEADRLFEMGFETALNEILQRLPASRQTLLFSATLPKSLVEFAKAGLKDPKLVRLDAESKISTDLKMAFFSIKQAEKDACLLSLLRDVIKVPFAERTTPEDTETGKAPRNTKVKPSEQITAPHQTLIFAATKHHVEYLQNMLTTANYAVSHIYGSLDQTARSFQMDQFRRGTTSILVVTDVAARGIDIPVLENVVNYDFPQGARVFVHRVGRTARAGRQGWAWSFVTNTELPYLLDLQLFLGRPLQPNVTSDDDQEYTQSLVLGTFEREKIDTEVEYLRSLDDANHSLPSLRAVMQRGHAMYERSKGKASPQSYKRAKEMIKDPKWMLAGSHSGIHPVLLRGDDSARRRLQEQARQALLRSVQAFTPSETVFEVAGKGNVANAALMKERRKALERAAKRRVSAPIIDVDSDEELPEVANETEVAVVTNASDRAQNYRDAEFYMSHYQKDATTEKGYSLRDGASFGEQARNATFDLVGDEGSGNRQRNQMTWDKKKRRFVKGDGVGADNMKLVKTENGTRLPATYRSGRFDEWKAKTRQSVPRVGEAEHEGSSRRSSNGQRFRHNAMPEAKPLDKLDKNYDRKVRHIKKKNEAAGGEAPQGRYRGKPIGRVKTELKTSEQIRKGRKLLEKRRAKNARPSKKGRR